MILYFSGTGNSEYAAKRIAKATGDEVLNLFEKIRSRDYSPLHASCPWVVVVPTYAWRIPRIVQAWLEHTTLAGSQDVYFVMTCGQSVGNADKYLKKLCAAKRMNYLGCAAIPMPENYIALFSTPAQDEARRLIEQAGSRIDEAALFIKRGQAIPSPSASLQDRIKSGLVNDLFYPMFVHAKNFYATGACISCGKCVTVCPLSNVRLDAGRPVWGASCTHCMACISRCPTQAIEYGTHSRGLPRYTCPEDCSQ